MMYICITCGYIYDEEKNEHPWATVSADWVCPDCGGSHSHFSELSIEKKKNEIDELFKNYDV